MNKFKFLGKIVPVDVRTLCGVTHKIRLSDVIIFLHLVINSAVVPFEDGFAGVFRCDNKAVQMNIFTSFSKDGIRGISIMNLSSLRLVINDWSNINMIPVLYGLKIAIG